MADNPSPLAMSLVVGLSEGTAVPISSVVCIPEHARCVSSHTLCAC